MKTMNEYLKEALKEVNEKNRQSGSEVSSHTSVTAKNLKKGMNIWKFGKVDNVSKQNHIVIAYSGKDKKKYDENEAVTILKESTEISESKMNLNKFRKMKGGKLRKALMDLYNEGYEKLYTLEIILGDMHGRTNDDAALRNARISLQKALKNINFIDIFKGVESIDGE
jgi:hypothetical protein